MYRHMFRTVSQLLEIFLNAKRCCASKQNAINQVRKGCLRLRLLNATVFVLRFRLCQICIAVANPNMENFALQWSRLLVWHSVCQKCLNGFYQTASFLVQIQDSFFMQTYISTCALLKNPHQPTCWFRHATLFLHNHSYTFY